VARQLAKSTERGIAPADSDISRSGNMVDVEGLQVRFPGDDGAFAAVRGVSLSIGPAERIGIVGESGSGKSLTVMAIAQLVSYPANVSWQALQIFQTDVAATPPRRLRTVLGTNLAMVFQDPMSSLNPALRIGRQMSEVAEVHNGMKHGDALDRAAEKLTDVGIPQARTRLRDYPHEFSGGMRQRVMIAMGLMETPKLIIADEPTTALDVTVQRQILDLLRTINDESGAAILLISHDIAVVTTVCERVVVMYAGRIVEELPTASLVNSAMHHYTRALIESVPDMATDRARKLATIAGRPPSVEQDPVGCAFAARCPAATERCTTERPELVGVGGGHRVACWHPHSGDVPADLLSIGSASGHEGTSL
jgi:peptide/nickel transport system permease protein